LDYDSGGFGLHPEEVNGGSGEGGEREMGEGAYVVARITDRAAKC